MLNPQIYLGDNVKIKIELRRSSPKHIIPSNKGKTPLEFQALLLLHPPNKFGGYA